MSSDGRISFATLIYSDDGADAINNFSDVLIGFDAGDTIRSATVLSPGFSSQHTLQPVNTFRIDGNSFRGGILHDVVNVHSTGHCITTAYPGEVCGLNSYAVGCDRNNLTATACRCYQDFNVTTPDASNQSHNGASDTRTEPSTEDSYETALNITSLQCDGTLSTKKINALSF